MAKGIVNVGSNVCFPQREEENVNFATILVPACSRSEGANVNETLYMNITL